MDFSDRSSYSWNKRFLTLIVAGILILVNILSIRFFARFDWTKDKQYSISDSTVELLQGLDDLVTVKAYFTSDLPPQLLAVKQYVRDILSEYKAYSGGNFDFQFVDPSEDANAAQEAQRVGVQQGRIQVRENDSFQVKNGYLGVGIFFKGKTESIPVIQEKDTSNIEYDLTSLIIKLTQAKLQEVGFLAGHGEHGIAQSVQGQGAPNNDNDYSTLAQVLAKSYDVKTVNLGEHGTLDGVDVLVVAGPKRDLSERDIFEIDQYLLNGGKAIFLVDGIEQVAGGVDVHPLSLNVQNLFQPLGITIPSNLLLDTSSELANFSEGPGQFFFLQYPPFIRLVAENFSQNLIVSKIPSMVVRFVSSIAITEKQDLSYDRFLNTSGGSWQQIAPFSVNPTSIPPATADQIGSKAVAVSVTGHFPRISNADSVPPLQVWQQDNTKKTGDKDQFKLVPVAQDDRDKGREVLKQAKAEAKLLLFSDSDFVSDQAVAQDQTPLVVLQNAVDSLTFGDKLISIRSKSLGNAALKELDASTKALMRFLGILLVPFLISFYGIMRLWVRRKEERLLKL